VKTTNFRRRRSRYYDANYFIFATKIFVFVVVCHFKKISASEALRVYFDDGDNDDDDDDVAGTIHACFTH